MKKLEYYFIFISLILCIQTIHTPAENNIEILEFQKNINHLLTALPIQNQTETTDHTKIYQELSTILLTILDKKQKEPIDKSIKKIQKILDALNTNNKLQENQELHDLFKKITHLNPTPKKEFISTLPKELQQDLQDKEIFEAVQFFISNKDKQSLWYSLFWLEADKTYHFLRVFNSLLPKEKRLHSIYPLLESINNKK
ncbi:MAG: hypothetical protein ACXWL5_00785 [Candidatus Chromulinivorax sp.]